MEFIKQISSLHKIRTAEDAKNIPEIYDITLLPGESYYYQLVIYGDEIFDVVPNITSDLKDSITLYKVTSVTMDYPTYPNADATEYITTTPGHMPDLLTPIHDGYHTKCFGSFDNIWVKIGVPKDIKPGEYDIKISFDGKYIYRLNEPNDISLSTALHIKVLNIPIPEQKTKFTQWFHTDCISAIHNVPIYSEKHWELIDKYMAMASELGINMILTPVITPPLDTGVGIERPNVQLVRMEKKGEEYEFDFSLLYHWIKLAKNNGIKYFEISHLFSQWGLEYAPNIYIWEDGELKHMFGWHVNAKDPEYARFLGQFIPKLVQVLKEEGIADNSYFHISDEPSENHIEAYNYAKNIIKPLIGDIKTYDALSDEGFYQTGAVEIPVPKLTKAMDFIKLDAKEKWTYYCCSQWNKVSNRFLAMSLSKTRILGLQMYKYGIEGFLQWGYNFYYSQFSEGLINPFTTTSSNYAFPSGDPFTVYPGVDGPLPSMRGYVFQNALQDIEICRLLESYIGKEKVVEIIDTIAGMNVTFEEYPENWDYIPKVMNEIKERIMELTK